jgi:hypothetical protein
MLKLTYKVLNEGVLLYTISVSTSGEYNSSFSLNDSENRKDCTVYDEFQDCVAFLDKIDVITNDDTLEELSIEEVKLDEPLRTTFLSHFDEDVVMLDCR